MRGLRPNNPVATEWKTQAGRRSVRRRETSLAPPSLPVHDVEHNRPYPMRLSVVDMGLLWGRWLTGRVLFFRQIASLDAPLSQHHPVNTNCVSGWWGGRTRTSLAIHVRSIGGLARYGYASRVLVIPQDCAEGLDQR
jgi:hypothetical protein